MKPEKLLTFTAFSLFLLGCHTGIEGENQSQRPYILAQQVSQNYDNTWIVVEVLENGKLYYSVIPEPSGFEPTINGSIYETNSFENLLENIKNAFAKCDNIEIVTDNYVQHSTEQKVKALSEEQMAKIINVCREKNKLEQPWNNLRVWRRVKMTLEPALTH